MTRPSLVRRSLFAVTTLATLAVVRSSVGADPQPGTTEPPQEFTLTVDGHATPIPLDKPTAITVGGHAASATLTLKPERQFAAPGLSFRYPQGHHFSADTSTPGVTTWNLGGGRNLIILSRMAANGDADAAVKEVLETMTSKFGPDKVSQKKGKVRLGGVATPCTDLLIDVATYKIHDRLLAIRTTQGIYLMILQDSPNDDGSTSADTQAVLDLFDETFKTN